MCGRRWGAARVEIRRLQQGLARWRSEGPAALLAALGFEAVGLRVPRSGLRDFGLDPKESLSLEVAARHSDFHVFRVVLEGRLEPDAIRRTAAALYRHNPARRALLAFEARGDDRIVFASWGLGPGPLRLLKLWIDTREPRAFELDILAGLAVDGAATPTDLAHAHIRALDREEVTRRFFVEFRRQRAELAAALKGVPQSAGRDRLDLALGLLSRLLFLYFLQRKGWMNGDLAYLRNLYESSLGEGVPFYRRRLKPLFFGALNRAPERRREAARKLGTLPFLNGGLFERDPLERAHSRLDVPDDSFGPIFAELLDKYQFTLSEGQPADQDVAVDPEMLGKVFEGLMSGSQRGSTGAFFTPRPLVDRLAAGALAAHLARVCECDRDLVDELMLGGHPEVEPLLRERLSHAVSAIRVLDPAVGSGAFLLAVLQRLELLRDVLDGAPVDSPARFERRQEIVRRNLHGVDVNAAAVRLCELRLWLALVVDLEVESVAKVPPLPNLDINIRQGDALIDPIDFLLRLGDLDYGGLAGRWQRRLRRLAGSRVRYFRSTGAEKRRVARSLARSERELAVGFLSELSEQVEARRRDLRLAARSRDLFGSRAGLTRAQKRVAANLKRRKREIAQLLRRLRDHDALPFFSFSIHFADPRSPAAEFDVVVGNPPWVRTHHWSGAPRRRLVERFRVLREAGWHKGTRLAGAGRGFGAQLDLSALFVERSLELLRPGGALGFLLPAKLLRVLSAGALREHLLASTTLLELEDCSLAAERLFDATTYPLACLLAVGRPPPEHRVPVRLHGRRGQPLDFDLPQSRLPLIREDGESPWALAAPTVRAALDRMRAAGPPLGSTPAYRPCRGIVTGSNSVFLGALVDGAASEGRARLRLSDSEVEIETKRLRPALRGEDLQAWRFATPQVLVWTHDDDGNVLAKLPPATRRHLRKHERVLRGRVDLKPGQPYWAIFRARQDKWGPRVAWRDIAPAPGAVVVPARTPFLQHKAPIISLNTVYQIAAASGEDAHFLAAVLNSTVARSYLKAIAERASGGYFRFLGWTVALLPFPDRRDAAARLLCIEKSRTAHAEGGLSAEEARRLDELVAFLYRLTPEQLSDLRAFDRLLTNPGDDEVPVV